MLREETYKEVSIPWTSGEVFSVTAETYSSDKGVFCKRISKDTAQIN